VTLDLLDAANKCCVFHISLIKPYLALVDSEDKKDTNIGNHLLTENEEEDPSPPIKITKKGPEHFIETIINQKKSSHRFCFLVKWQGFPDSHNEWMTFTALKHTSGLDTYLKHHDLS
jgi:hypothetical protein